VLAFDPRTDEWSSVRFPMQSMVWGSVAMVWTGNDVLFWGYPYHSPREPAFAFAYRPETGEWRPFDTGPLPFREWFGATWAGTELIVWGGSDHFGMSLAPGAGDGAAYDPATNTWRVLSVSPLPDLYRPSLLWDGSRVLVWGYAMSSLPTGASYDRAADNWTTFAVPPTEVGNSTHAVTAWTGRELIAADRTSGLTLAPVPRTAAYDPDAQSWRLLDDPPGGAACDSTGVWTGSELIVWGGTTDCDDDYRRGGFRLRLQTSERASRQDRRTGE
jgi:hypothetical protein